MRLIEKLAFCVAVVALALVAAAPAEPEPEAPPARPIRERLARGAERARPERLALALLNPWAGQETSSVDLPGQLFQLNDEQKAKLGQLAQQQQEEKRKLLDGLDAQYADRVKGVLSDEQKVQYEDALAALKRAREAIRAAEAELEAAVGQEVAARAKTAVVRPGQGVQLVRFLELSDEQKKELMRLQRERADKLSEATKNIQRPADREDREALRKYSEEMRAAQEAQNAEYEAKVKNLLTAEQSKQLGDLEKALQVYQDKVRAAQQAFREELDKALAPR